MKVNNTKCKRAAIYVNQLSDLKGSNTIELKLCTVREFAERNGLSVVNVYQDEVDSTTEKRPVFQDMIRDARTKAFDVVLVFKLDEFASDKYDLVYYKQILKESEVMLLSVTEPPLENPEIKMLESILAGLLEYYQRNLANEDLELLVES